MGFIDPKSDWSIPALWPELQSDPTVSALRRWLAHYSVTGAWSCWCSRDKMRWHYQLACPRCGCVRFEPYDGLGHAEPLGMAFTRLPHLCNGQLVVWASVRVGMNVSTGRQWIGPARLWDRVPLAELEALAFLARLRLIAALLRELAP